MNRRNVNRRNVNRPNVNRPNVGETLTPATMLGDMLEKKNDRAGAPSGAAKQHLLDEGEIGAGASGSVRKAYDSNLRRSVAIKVLAPDLLRKPGVSEQFVQESRLMAGLDHPNIVPVHDLVVGDGSAYFVMKLVRGRTLETVVGDAAQGEDSSSDTRYKLLSAYLKICDAVAFAHSRRIIHCDLKPANIMLGEFGEAYLMDWGIASEKVADTDGPGSKQRRRVRGTPAYMSPEQAEGRVAAITERTDVFGLGAVLYFILTGRSPFEGKTTTASLTRARACNYEDPEAIAKLPIPPGLLRIVRKAMSHDPRERHATVLELRHSVETVFQGDWLLPTKVFPPGSVIVKEGDWADAAYILVRGRCRVSKIMDGHGQEIRILEPGAVFGETGILSGDVRTATVEAIDEVTAKLVTRQLFDDQLGRDTWLGKFVLALADRFRELDQKLAQLTLDVSERRK